MNHGLYMFFVGGSTALGLALLALVLPYLRGDRYPPDWLPWIALIYTLWTLAFNVMTVKWAVGL